ncbi:MAG: tetratricopeptide repeat protein [Thermoguttaceae bacterium]|nr:tetratricopeptide repeat protein [Thermoguttaceae bacterium]
MTELARRSFLLVRGVAPSAAFFLFAILFSSNCGALFAQQQEAALIQQGMSAHSSKQYDAAINAFERYIQLYPNGQARNQAELYAGHAYMTRNGEYPTAADATAAQTHFDNIIRQGDRAQYYKEATFHTAHLAFSMREYERAQAYFQQFLGKYPNDGYAVYAYYYLAKSDAKLRQRDAAIQDYERALSLNPNQELAQNCRFERAVLIGQNGNYQMAESELSALASSNLTSDLATQVAGARAMLRSVQGDYKGALALLDDFVSRYGTSRDPYASDAIMNAYLGEAYMMLQMKDYDRALQFIEENFERDRNFLPPRVALLKIKLLLIKKRFDDAAALLNNLANSNYGREKPDVVTSYRALLDLSTGKYDDAIANLTTLLGVKATQTSTPNYSGGAATAVTIDYLGYTGEQYLGPISRIEACETLILAYASRYAATKSRQDYDYQDAIYREVGNYVNWLNQPAAKLLIGRVDERRQAALKVPFAESNDGSYYVVSPYANDSYASTPGTFANPTSASAYVRPNYYTDGVAKDDSLYRPNDYYTSDNYRWNLRDPNRYDANDPSGYGSAGSANSRYNDPPGPAPNLQPGGSRASAQTNPANGVANYPANSAPANQGAPTNQPNQQPPANQGYQPGQNQPSDPNQQGAQQAQNQGANSDENSDGGEERKLTPQEAQKELLKAQTFYSNQEYSRCNETLLEALTSSETFWQDCPSVAPKMALLRADALSALGMRSEAQMSYQNAIDNAPYSLESTIAAARLGFNYDALGRSDEAVAYLRKATTAGATSPFTDAALYYLGMNEKERGDFQSAKQDFLRLYREFPSSSYWSHGTWALASIEADQRNDREAEKLVNEALGKKPDSAIIDYLLFLKGEIAYRAKDYEKALIAFDMIVDQYPDSELYSKAKNRLAAVPEKFRGGYDALDEEYEEFDEEPLPRPARPSTPSGAERRLPDTDLERFDPRTAPSSASPRPSGSGQPRETTGSGASRPVGTERSATPRAGSPSPSSSAPSTSRIDSKTPIPSSPSSKSSTRNGSRGSSK